MTKDAFYDNWKIEIINNGRSEARNLKVKLPDEIKGRMTFDYSSVPEILSSADNIAIMAKLRNGHPDTIEILLKWDDDFKNNNEIKKHIHFRKYK